MNDKKKKETTIKHLSKPKREDFNTFKEYMDKQCDYLIEKYKDTYVKE